MVPDNIVNMFISAVITKYKTVNVTTNPPSTRLERVLTESPGVNILGILVGSLAVGLIAGSLDEREVEPFINFFKAATRVLTRLLERIMLILPLGMACLVLKAIAEIEEAEGALKALGMFVATNVAFLSCLALVLLPMVFITTTGRNPFILFKNISSAILTAFSTVSSLTALPDVFVCVEKNYDMNSVSSQLLGPFLTSFNANGSAAFISACVLFCAQWSGVYISIGNMFIIFLLAGINVMALPAVPSSSIVIVLLILRSFGIPEVAVSLLYVPEFINDRMRTMVNVESHIVCLLTVNAFEKRRYPHRRESDTLDSQKDTLSTDVGRLKQTDGDVEF